VLDQRRELAPALDAGNDLVLLANRLQDASVGGEAGLAATLARKSQLDEQDLPQLLGRADRELLLGELIDALLEARDLLAHAPRDLLQALHVEAHAEHLHLAQHRHQWELDVVHHTLEPTLGYLLALPRRERAEHQHLSSQWILDVGDEPT